MKKILYSLMAFAGLMTTSCISFDDPVTENYGVGPTAQITVESISDNAFTFEVNPGENALYYSIVVDESADTAALDATTLLKGGYSSVYNIVTKTTDNATFTYDMCKADGTPLCKAGTTYQIYAVAANDKGVVGEVVVKTVTTTDQVAPKPLQYEYDAENKAMFVLFSEPIARGEGAVKVVSYKLYDLLNGSFGGEVIPAEEVMVLTQDDQIAIVVPTSYAGAYLAFSWEAGAFVDAAGHSCAALNSGFNPSAGNFAGLVGLNDNESFEITADNLVEPELDSVIEDWEAFYGTMMFDMNIVADEPEADAITVVYSNDVTETAIKLEYGSQWDVSANTFVFVLPSEPAPGDKISLKIAEGAFYDVYGNPNAAVEFNNAWTMSTGVAVSEATFTGVFSALAVSAYDGASVDLGSNIYIYAVPEVDSYVPEGCKAVGIENLILDGSIILGYYDLKKGKFGVAAMYEVGTVQMNDGTQYGSITYSLSGQDWIVFDVTKDGTLVSTDLAWVACDLEYTKAEGWLDKFSTTVLTRTGDLPAQAPSLKKKFEANPFKFSVNNLPRLKK